MVCVHNAVDQLKSDKSCKGQRLTQAGVTDLEKVITGDKVFPVVTKRAFGSTAVLLLAKGVLVDNGVLERLKQAWGDPRF